MKGRAHYSHKSRLHTKSLALPDDGSTDAFPLCCESLTTNAKHTVELGPPTFPAQTEKSMCATFLSVVFRFALLVFAGDKWSCQMKVQLRTSNGRVSGV
jgi:hypothetical protein